VSVKSLTIGGSSGTQTLAVESSSSANASLGSTAGLAIGTQGAVTLTNGGLCANGVTLGGSVTNAGTITVEPGTGGGARNLEGNLTNTGTLAVDANTSFNRSKATLTNEGAVNLAKGLELYIASGDSFTNGAGGSIAATGSARTCSFPTALRSTRGRVRRVYEVFSTKTPETLFTNTPLSVLPSSSSKTGVTELPASATEAYVPASSSEALWYAVSTVIGGHLELESSPMVKASAPVSTVPTVSSVSPALGSVNGGTPIKITGTNFVPGAKVEIGQGNGPGSTAIAATEVVVVSPTEITAVTGGTAKAGTWNLYVIDSGAPASPPPVTTTHISEITIGSRHR
jgi:hypothetical protein